jgi:tryptophanyl-tRNA synthetase
LAGGSVLGKMPAMRVLTGIKASGTPHLGNLVGAIRPALELAAKENNDALFFVADYHGLTSVHEPAALAHSTRDIAATWLACGLDPDKIVFYRQSRVPEIFELAWILACFTSKGWMNKAHAYKAKIAARLEEAAGAPVEDIDAGIDMGLYEYPILMAADILAFDTHAVPVGADQVQHIEIARDIADRINHVYGAKAEAPLLVPPKPLVTTQILLPGTDGRKMSKSYDNVIPLFASAKELKKTVMRVVTDSTPPETPKDPDTSHVYQIHRFFLDDAAAAALAERYRAGIGWGDAKKALAERLEEVLGEKRARYEQLMASPAELDGLLAAGEAKARAIAGATLARVRTAIGIAG